MESQLLPPKSLSAWKKLAVVSVFSGAGFAFMCGLLLAGLYWYNSRPTRPKPWITNVIVAKGSPGFDVSNDGKNIEFGYTLENQGSNDYHIDSSSDVQIFLRGKDGTLSSPLPDPTKHLRVPLFIPPRQKALTRLSLDLSEIPTRVALESDSAFHERIRAYLEKHAGGVGGFVIFDATNHYEIELPKWLASAPPDPTGNHP